MISVDDPVPQGISCLMAFYARDDPAHFAAALSSVAAQRRPPDEVLLVQDGPVPDKLSRIAKDFGRQLPTQHLVLAQNRGLGVALGTGVRAAHYDLVARMDADDLNRTERFELQERALRCDPQLLIVGSAMEEFQYVPGDIGYGRPVTCDDRDIRQAAKGRNPFNHMTVMFRRAAVLGAGNYRHMPSFEDYDLWLRLLQLPGHVRNLPEVLMDVRVGNGMVSRRRGLSYARAEWAFLSRCRSEGLLSTWDFARSAAMRLPARMAPARVVELIYQHMLRRR